MLNLIKNSKLGDRLGKLLRSSLWNATANFLVKINFLVLTFFCSQVFAIDDFGRFAIVLSTLMSFQIFASMGLATAAAKFSALYRDTDRVVPMLSSVTLLLLFFSCVSALFLYFLGEYISKEILKDESLKVYLEISSVTLLFAALKSLFTGLLQGIGEYRTISSSNLKSVLITIPVFFILAYFFGLIGAVIGLLFIELTFALSLLIKSINRQCFYFRFFLIKKINICEVLKFTLPISLSGMLIMPVNWYLLKEVAVNYSYLEVGAINVLNQWQAVLVFIPLSIGTVMMPMMTNANEQKNTYIRMTKIIFLFSFVVVFFYSLAIDWIISLYGSDYNTLISPELISMFALCVIIVPLNNQVLNYVLSIGKPNVLMVANIFWCVLTVALFESLIIQDGILTKYFFVRFISYFVSTALMILVCTKISRYESKAIG